MSTLQLTIKVKSKRVISFGYTKFIYSLCHPYHGYIFTPIEIESALYEQKKEESIYNRLFF